MDWLRRKIRNWLHIVHPTEYVVGGNCGCCGKWVVDCLVEEGWPWTLCRGCDCPPRGTCDGCELSTCDGECKLDTIML